MKSLIITLIFISSIISAQIPNAGFEQWGNDNLPSDWFTSNIDQIAVPITKTSDSYSNSYALKGEVVKSALGDTIIPAILAGEYGTGFPIEKKYTNLKLYYKFNSAGGDIFTVIVWMFSNDQFIGVGAEQVEESKSEFTLLNVPIEYAYDATPNSALIEILAGNMSDSSAGNLNTYFIVDDISFDEITDVDNGEVLQAEFKLNQNYPNPFNPTTQISFYLNKDGNAAMNIFNVLGENVATLFNEHMKAGEHKVEWNANNLPSGIYYYNLTSGENTITKKMLLVK